VFLSDNPDAHRHMVRLAAALDLCRVGGMAYGLVDWFNAPTGHRATTRFLTVPHQVLPPAAVDLWMELAERGGAPSETGPGGKDIIALSARPEALMAFVTAVREGKCHPANPENN
jgi:hypothetical protein